MRSPASCPGFYGANNTTITLGPLGFAAVRVRVVHRVFCHFGAFGVFGVLLTRRTVLANNVLTWEETG